MQLYIVSLNAWAHRLAFSRLLFRFFLKSLRCHLGSHLSGSGLGPGFSGSKFLGSLGFLFLFFFPLTTPLARSASEGRFLETPLLARLPAVIDHSLLFATVAVQACMYACCIAPMCHWIAHAEHQLQAVRLKLQRPCLLQVRVAFADSTVNSIPFCHACPVLHACLPVCYTGILIHIPLDSM